MNYVIFNHDGSVYYKSITETINQNSDGVNKFFVAIRGFQTSLFSVVGVFRLPNGTSSMRSSDNETVTQIIDNVSYTGYVITLSAIETTYAGNLVMSIMVKHPVTHATLWTYPLFLTINKTVIDSEAPISVTEYNTLLLELNKLTQTVGYQARSIVIDPGMTDGKLQELATQDDVQIMTVSGDDVKPYIALYPIINTSFQSTERTISFGEDKYIVESRPNKVYVLYKVSGENKDIKLGDVIKLLTFTYDYSPERWVGFGTMGEYLAFTDKADVHLLASKAEVEILRNGLREYQGKVDAMQSSIINANLQISTIQQKIPATASYSNKLATFDDVRKNGSHFLTRTASGEMFQSEEQLRSATQFYWGGVLHTPDENDIAYVVDSNGTTQYAYVNEVWVKQITVLTNTLTDTQLIAINSGIDSDLVELLKGYYEIMEYDADNDALSVFGKVRVMSYADLIDAEGHIIGMSAEEKNRLAKALVIPTPAITNTELVGVNSSKDQVRIQLGDGLELEGNTLKATGGGVDATAMHYKKLTYDGTHIKDGDNILNFSQIKALVDNVFDFVYIDYPGINATFYYDAYEDDAIWFQAKYLINGEWWFDRIIINAQNQINYSSDIMVSLVNGKVPTSVLPTNLVTTTAQTLTEQEKAQVRANIGVGTSGTVDEVARSQISEVSNVLNDISNLEETTENVKFDFVSGGIDTLTGVETQDERYCRTDFIEANKGTKVHFNRTVNNIALSLVIYKYDSGKSFIGTTSIISGNYIEFDNDLLFRLVTTKNENISSTIEQRISASKESILCNLVSYKKIVSELNKVKNVVENANLDEFNSFINALKPIVKAGEDFSGLIKTGGYYSITNNVVSFSSADKTSKFIDKINVSKYKGMKARVVVDAIRAGSSRSFGTCDANNNVTSYVYEANYTLDNGKYYADIVIDNDFMFFSISSNATTIEIKIEDLINVYTKLEIDNEERKYYHFSFDDVIQCLEDITLNKDTYSSIFQNQFFNWCKNMHEKYNCCFSFYVFYNDNEYINGWNLSQCTDKFSNEFKENSSWMKFGFHSYEQGATATSRESSIETDYSNTINELVRITGSIKCIDRMPRLQAYNGTLVSLKKLRDCDLGCVGFLASKNDSETTSRDSYYFTEEQNNYINKHIYMHDYENHLHFVKTSYIWGSYTTAENIENSIRFANENMYVELFTHENQLSSGMKTFYEDRIKSLSKTHKPMFFMNKIL